MRFKWVGPFFEWIGISSCSQGGQGKWIFVGGGLLSRIFVRSLEHSRWPKSFLGISQGIPSVF